VRRPASTCDNCPTHAERSESSLDPAPGRHLRAFCPGNVSSSMRSTSAGPSLPPSWARGPGHLDRPYGQTPFRAAISSVMNRRSGNAPISIVVSFLKPARPAVNSGGNVRSLSGRSTVSQVVRGVHICGRSLPRRRAAARSRRCARDRCQTSPFQSDCVFTGSAHGSGPGSRPLTARASRSR
jgi:hypothetical protein